MDDTLVFLAQKGFFQQDFFWQIFAESVALSKSELSTIFDLKKEALYCKRYALSNNSQSYLFRARHRAKQAAHFVISEKGLVEEEKLEKLILLLEKEGAILTPDGFSDQEIQNHLLAQLKKFLKAGELFGALERFSLPLPTRFATQLILYENELSLTQTPTLKQLRCAIFSALLTPLYQEVGSCFATAPAILVQSEQPLQLVKDLYELLYTSRLTRTVAGVQYAVPIAQKSGGINQIQICSGSVFSPSIHAAFLEGDLFTKESGFDARCAILQAKLIPFLGEQLTTFQWMHRLLLEEFGLDQEELDFSFGSYPKKELVLQFKEKERVMNQRFLALLVHPLLKMWEYTLASLSESRMDFVDWNLCKGLGLDPVEEGGLGAILRDECQKLIEEEQNALDGFKNEYESARVQLDSLRMRLQRGDSGSSSRHELELRTSQLEKSVQRHNECVRKIKNYRLLPATLTEIFCEKFKEHFQEIYDPDLYLSNETVYNGDRPAGFRLVYKQGKKDPIMWSAIENEEHYIRALTGFFSLIENEVKQILEEEEEIFVNCEKILSELIYQIHSKDFLKQSKLRMEKAGKKMPWASISGGTISHLLEAYFRREQPLFFDQIVETNELDLCVVLIDKIKRIQSRKLNKLLITSNSHAFTVLLDKELFAKAIEDSGYTYTFVRDQVLDPARSYYKELVFSEKEQEALVQAFVKAHQLPLQTIPHYARTLSEKRVTLPLLRSHLISVMDFFTGRHFGPEKKSFVDSFIYSMVPLHSGYGWKGKVAKLLEGVIPALNLEPFPEIGRAWMGWKELIELAAAMALVSGFTGEKALFPLLRKKAAQLGFAPPEPLFFGGTNWAENLFGFHYNGGSERFELWRFDPSSVTGSPMHSWQEELDGKKGWKLFSKPSEYTT